MADALVLDSADALPAEARALLADAPFQLGSDWWRAASRAALPARSTARFVLCREAGRAVALFPLLLLDDGARLSSFCTPYTVTWRPLVAAEADAALLVRAGAALGRACGRWPVMQWDALDPDWNGLPPLLAGLRQAGYRAARFQHFGNWHEPVGGIGWGAYLAARPGALRETIRRKQARIERTPGLSLHCARTPDEAEPAIAAYLDVYRRSWKQPEPYPEFDATLLRAAAAAGVLRLGTLTENGVTLAAQYWVVSQGVATVLKLAHDMQHRAMSPGTVLTAWMIRRLIEDDAVQTLDFGRGDDPYKQLWTSQRGGRIGLVLADPWRPRGAAALLRQWGGQPMRRLRGR